MFNAQELLVASSGLERGLRCKRDGAVQASSSALCFPALSSAFASSQGPQGEPGPPGQQGNPGAQVRGKKNGMKNQECWFGRKRWTSNKEICWELAPCTSLAPNLPENAPSFGSLLFSPGSRCHGTKPSPGPSSLISRATSCGSCLTFSIPHPDAGSQKGNADVRVLLSAFGTAPLPSWG